MSKKTILLYGRTNAGKTAQIAKLAEYVFKTTGKITRLYTGDLGGTHTIKPYINIGLIEAVELGSSDPFIFLNNAVRGRVKTPDGKWNTVNNDHIGMFAFESLRSFAENLMSNMAGKAAQNVSIGGGSNISFQVTEGDERVKVSGSNMAHFGVAQSQMTEAVWTSQKLNAPYIIWTSSVSKDEDTTSAGKILGPDVIGKALTAEVPRWFNYTFRIDVLPAKDGKAERHILYLGNHIDLGAGGAAGLGNIRLPLDAPPVTQTQIEPADLVQALTLIENSYTQAENEIKKRLGTQIVNVK